MPLREQLDHSFLLHAIHQDLQWALKTHVAYVFCLVDGRHRVENLLAVDIVTRVGIDGKVAYTEASKVLEEVRSEEHTSELQSRQYLVCRLLLEKKKNKRNQQIINNTSYITTQ